MSVESVFLQETPTDATFDEASYLVANADVAAAVAARRFRSGRAHFEKFGRAEGRRQRAHGPTSDDIVARIRALRAGKLAALESRLTRRPLSYGAHGAANFLDVGDRARHGLDDTDAISENGYDDETIALIDAAGSELVLDVGAGLRPAYYANVVNYEIVDYPTTDVIGAGEDLPFKDGTFAGVLSIAVLEHVRDPFRCAAEIARVLKPGGWLKCCVPFLQPLHGYPHHYFNMTHEGLRNLFEPYLLIERQEVTPPTHPIWAIAWQLRSWADGLSLGTRKEFLRMRVEDLIGYPGNLVNKPFARELSQEKLFELAAATILHARKADV